MLKRIAIVVVVLLVALLLFATTKPNSFRVERATYVKAPPEKIFPLISNFHSWAAWSPFEKLDTAMKKTMSGAPSGKGAIYEWEGNMRAGTGRMEITEASPGSSITIKLDFLKPFRSRNTAEFTLQPAGDSTRVTWAMYGPNLYIGKVISVFASMDKMAGKELETGLASLKALAER